MTDIKWHHRDDTDFEDLLFRYYNHVILAETNITFRISNSSFFNHCNYIEVQPSRHADDFTVYVHTGNCVSNLNWYDEEFKSFARSSPKIAERFVDDAIAHLKKIKANFKKT